MIFVLTSTVITVKSQFIKISWYVIIDILHQQIAKIIAFFSCNSLVVQVKHRSVITTVVNTKRINWQLSKVINIRTGIVGKDMFAM